jgi:hypothetical protein
LEGGGEAFVVRFGGGWEFAEEGEGVGVVEGDGGGGGFVYEGKEEEGYEEGFYVINNERNST